MHVTRPEKKPMIFLSPLPRGEGPGVRENPHESSAFGGLIMGLGIQMNNPKH
jgi:hypothetical protein